MTSAPLSSSVATKGTSSLLNAEPRALTLPGRDAGGAHLEWEGLQMVRLRGTEVERARLHGRLLRERIRAGAIPKLASKNEWLIRRGPGPLETLPFLHEPLVLAFRRLLVPWMGRSIPAELQQVLHAMAIETGLSYETFMQATLQAEGMMLLSRVSIMKHLLQSMPVKAMPACSSAVVMPEATKSGRILHARNQDYPMVGSWESNATVLFHEPTEPGRVPHVAVTTAGVHTSGLTSMNREGITLAAHAHFGRKVRFAGRSVVDLGNEIISKSRCLGDAIDLARRNRRFANWAYVVSSAREGTAVVIEMTPDRIAVREPEQGLLTHTNYFQSPELQGEEALVSGSFVEDLGARICEMREAIGSRRGSIDAAALAETLGSHHDPVTDENRLFGNTVSVPDTIKSVVLDPGAQKFWMSTNPEAPTGFEGRFVEIDAEGFWSSEAGRVAAPTKVVQGWRAPSDAFREGIRHFRDAYKAWHSESDRDDFRMRALAALERCVAAYPDDGHAWVQLGLVRFKLGRFDAAGEALDEALNRPLSRHTRAVTRLFLARVRDLQNRRGEAGVLYENALKEAEEPRLIAALNRGRDRPYRAEEVTSVDLFLQFPDALQY